MSGRPFAAWTRPRLRLWHLVAAVTASALVLGLARALGRAMNVSLGVAVLITLSTVIGGALFVRSVRLGLRLGKRASCGLIDWGMDREGPVGFLAVMIGSLVYGTFLLGIIGLGLIATVILFMLFPFLLSR